MTCVWFMVRESGRTTDRYVQLCRHIKLLSNENKCLNYHWSLLAKMDNSNQIFQQHAIVSFSGVYKTEGRFTYSYRLQCIWTLIEVWVNVNESFILKVFGIKNAGALYQLPSLLRTIHTFCKHTNPEFVQLQPEKTPSLICYSLMIQENANIVRTCLLNGRQICTVWVVPRTS